MSFVDTVRVAGRRSGPAAALIAALLFGVSTPLAKVLLGSVPALLLAGLLYLGSGIGLSIARLAGKRSGRSVHPVGGNWPWLAAAIAFGGVLGPALLLFGLAHASAATASLLLNLETVFTALIAWLIFREHTGPRVVIGLLAIVAGAALLSWPRSGRNGGADPWAVAAIAGACLCWALDNNFTHRVAASDSLFIAGTKGLAAGVINCTLALAMGAQVPALPALGGALMVGLIGYGVSLVLFVFALRNLGTARTGAYFATAPFIGAALSVLMLHEPAPRLLWLAGGLMAAGVWLHLTERHQHEHTHEALTHTHSHTHDDHHRHAHPTGWDGREPHSHEHVHAPVTHTHPHHPDIHHRHSH